MRCLSLAALAALLSFTVSIRADDVAEEVFFESRIRPVLVEQCYSCHATDAKELKAGLLLDSAPGMLKGGESGPALVPGEPTESLLIEAIKYEGLEMPPSAKLPDHVVRDFEEWVTRGAPDPRKSLGKVRPSAPAASQIDIEAGRDFWAFKPIRDYETPDVDDVTWPESEVDAFVLFNLEQRDFSQPRMPVLRPPGQASQVVLGAANWKHTSGSLPQAFSYFERFPRPLACSRVRKESQAFHPSRTH